jgi:CDP-glucose 4,6-dehydratase
LVRRGYNIPQETFDVNVQGTVNILEAVRNCPRVQYTLVATTDKVFGPCDPYSASKTCQEIVAQSYKSSFNLPVSTARAGNCIGGGDWAEDRLIPDCVRAALKGEIIQVRNPFHKRPWQHVLDALHGYLMMIEEKSRSTGLFIPPQKTVEMVVDGFCNRWGARWKKVSDIGPHEEVAISATSPWKPRWSLNVALDKTVEWYKEWKEGKDMRRVCEKQIEEYLESPLRG